MHGEIGHMRLFTVTEMKYMLLNRHEVQDQFAKFYLESQ